MDKNQDSFIRYKTERYLFENLW